MNNHASTSDLYQDHLRTLRDHLNNRLDLLSLRSLLASTMMQKSSAGVTAVTPLQGDLLYYQDHFNNGRLCRSNKGSIEKLILTSQESGQLRQGKPISCYYFARWLSSRLSLMELRIPLIAPPLRLAVAFICRALRFLSTPTPLARKALICK